MYDPPRAPRCRCVLWWAWAFLLMPSPALGQVSLETLCQQALENHPTIRALSQRQLAKKNHATASAYPAPPTFQIMGSNKAQYGAVMQQTHLWGTYLRRREARLHEERAAGATSDDARRRITHEITLLYASIFATEQKIALHAAYQDFLGNLARVHVHSLTATHVDEDAWVMTRREIAQTTLDTLELERQLQQTTSSLQAWVGGSEGEATSPLTFHAKATLQATLIPNALTSLESSYGLKKDGRSTQDFPALKAPTHQLQSLQTQADLSSWLHRTKVQVQVQKRFHGTEQNPPWIFSLGVQMPLWSQEYAAHKARLTAQAVAQASLIDAQRRDFSAQLRTLLHSVRSYEKSLAHYREVLLPLLTHHTTSAESAYKAQKKTLADVVTSKQKLHKAELMRHSTWMHLVASASKIQMLTGTKVITIAHRLHSRRTP